MLRLREHPQYTRIVCGAALVALAWGLPVRAHVFIFDTYRVGAAPAYDGSGWICEAYLNIPEASAAHLIAAENYVVERPPDFTFRTPWIDFPAGPEPFADDTEFDTMGDFLDDYIYDVSDPSKLDEPFGHFLLRFRGYVSVRLEDDIQPPLLEGGNTLGLPVWVEFGSFGFDGYRTRIVDTIYRIPIANPANPFFHENSIILGLGLYPIEVTYFNHYDPNGQVQMDKAGIELYSWHGDGLAWPGGDNLVHTERGPATLVPPRVIYQAEDIVPLILGDFDADSDIDLLDYRWLQTCFTGPGEDFFLDDGCNAFDFDGDGDVDWEDFAAFVEAGSNPR